MEDCVFCRIARGELPSEIVYRDDAVFVIRDISPKAPVHMLVIPLDHIEALSQYAHGREQLIGSLATVAARVAGLHAIIEQGYRLVINQGPGAGQTVPHLHMHVLGGRNLESMG